MIEHELELERQEVDASRVAQSPNLRLRHHRALHDSVRTWAYRARADHDDEAAWREAVIARAEAEEAIWGARRPVLPAVTEQIATEIADWVWAHFDAPARTS